MDYEKKYNEALDAIKKLQEANPSDEGIQNWVNDNFPQLRESEDEKIKKALINYFDNANKSDENPLMQYGIQTDKVITWLEKQGEKDTTNKVEPKFQNGQWIVWQNKCYKVNYNGCGYELIDQNDLKTSLEYETVDENAHLWTIQDAKDGDVLRLGVVTAIFQKYIGNGNCRCYCSVYNGEFEIPSQDGDDNSYGCIDAIPATKEQRTILFQKLEEAGYKWDTDKKELKKIVVPIFNIGNTITIKHNLGTNKIYFTITDITGGKYWYNDSIICDITEQDEWKLVEQNYVWSEEDSLMIDSIIDTIKWLEGKGTTNMKIDWLKSLKQRMEEQQ